MPPLSKDELRTSRSRSRAPPSGASARATPNRTLRAAFEQALVGHVAALRAVEAVWGGGPDGGVQRGDLRTAVLIARFRRMRLEGPLEGAPESAWHEVHQGARRPETLERVRLMRKLNRIFERFRDCDPQPYACVCLDRAAEASARGLHDETRQHLLEARRVVSGLEESHQLAFGTVTLAFHEWTCGEVARALALLAALDSDAARDLEREIQGRERARTALRCAEQAHRDQGDLESWCEVVHAHLRAGHLVLAEQVAHEICRVHPARSLAWFTLASVLHRLSRDRDAVGPARKAVELGGGHEAKRLLAEIAGFIGSDGRDVNVGVVEMPRGLFGGADCGPAGTDE